MGQSEATHSIRNRHFTSLILKESESPSNSRLVGTVSIPSQAQLDQWTNDFQEIQKEENILMLLPLQWSVAHSSLCGSSKLIELHYEPYPRLLSEEAQLRSEQNRHLQESQIWYIVWAVAEVAERCGKNEQRLSGISLDNIFMNATGNVKLLTPYSLPNSYDPYFEPNPVDVYFSPEELRCRQLGQMHNETDIIKSSSFATGMLLLSLSLLKPLHYLYNYNQNAIDTNKLKQEIKNLEKIQYLSLEFNIFQFYSENYQKLLTKLLEKDPAQRITVTQVREQLQPHLGNIANLKSFYFQVPQSPIVSPNRSIKKQHTITLGSHKIKRTHTIQSPPSGTEEKTVKREEHSPNPIAVPRLSESKYISGSSQFKDLGSGLELLRRIDEKLMRSLQEFPS